jgi:hypothetical protein
MSTDRIAVATLEDFIKKVRLAIKTNQKEIKLPISDAEAVVHNLSLVLLRLLVKNQSVDVIKEAQEDVVIVAMDGGGFENTR